MQCEYVLWKPKIGKMHLETYSRNSLELLFKWLSPRESLDGTSEIQRREWFELCRCKTKTADSAWCVTNVTTNTELDSGSFFWAWCRQERNGPWSTWSSQDESIRNVSSRCLTNLRPSSNSRFAHHVFFIVFLMCCSPLPFLARKNDDWNSMEFPWGEHQRDVVLCRSWA